MEFNCGKKTAYKDIYKWHKWFALYPVRVANKCIWLERVETKAVWRDGQCDMEGYTFKAKVLHWEYRAIEEAKDE